MLTKDSDTLFGLTSQGVRRTTATRPGHTAAVTGARCYALFHSSLSQSVKTSSVAAVRGFDTGKKINGRKRHLLVDTMGLLLAVVVTAASVSDPAGARLLVARLGGACKKLRKLWWTAPIAAHWWIGWPIIVSSCSSLCCAATT